MGSSVSEQQVSQGKFKSSSQVSERNRLPPWHTKRLRPFVATAAIDNKQIAAMAQPGTALGLRPSFRKDFPVQIRVAA